VAAGQETPIPRLGAEQHLRAAVTAESRGAVDEALAHYRALVTFVPDHPGALLRLAQHARDGGDRVHAVALVQRAIMGARRLGLRADAAPLYAELATTLREIGKLDDSLAAARAGLEHCGELGGLIWEECQALRALGKHGQRAARLNRLAALQPADPVVLAELGLALLETPSAAQAVRPLRAALDLGLDDDDTALALAGVELRVREFGAAETRLGKILGRAPDHLGALGLRWLLLRLTCRWPEAEVTQHDMLRQIATGAVHPALSPFMLLSCEMAPSLLRDYTHRFQQLAGATSVARPDAPHHGGPLRIGYLSSDFHDHATAILMAGLFEQHDRSRFETFAFSYGPLADSPYRNRLRAAFAHWHDINTLSDAEAAALIRQQQIDVLVELKGITYGSRLGILNHGPAPVTLHYIGYPGTLAHPGIDYLVTDPIVSPPGSEADYAEPLLRLPVCYQVNDDRRERPTATSRSSLGLPDDAVVLCNFNQASKWTAQWFHIWLRALQSHPASVLWLLDPGDDARAVLDAQIAASGVSDRVVWAPRVSPENHLQRLGAADLALDQYPYGSHTTGADALWTGVPMLTCLGSNYAGRVGASLLSAVGLDELITDSPEAYASKLANLLDDRALLRSYRDRLANPATLPLFDTAGFTRAWEDLLMATHARARTAPNP